MHTCAKLYPGCHTHRAERTAQTSPTRRAIFLFLFSLFFFSVASSKYEHPCTDTTGTPGRLRVVFYNNKQAVLERGDCEIHRLSIVESLDYY
jgi:hypothetical protein